MDKVIENADQIEFSVPGDAHVIVPFKSHDTEVLVILNQQIMMPLRIFEKLWCNAKLHIAVDGGADQLLEYCESNSIPISKYIPDYVIGDFDSITQETKKQYSDLGCIMIHQETQYSTDFMKAISLCNLVLFGGYDGGVVDKYDGIAQLESKLPPSSLKRTKLFILGGIGGRLDQTIHSISMLYKYIKTNSHLQIMFINKEMEDLIFIVPQGKNFIQVNTDTSSQKRIIGLLPFGPQVTLNTEGLKWDIRDWTSEIDTKVSSSNHIVSNQGFVISNDRDIILNMVIYDNDFL